MIIIFNDYFLTTAHAWSITVKVSSSQSFWVTNLAHNLPTHSCLKTMLMYRVIYELSTDYTKISHLQHLHRNHHIYSYQNQWVLVNVFSNAIRSPWNIYPNKLAIHDILQNTKKTNRHWDKQYRQNVQDGNCIPYVTKPSVSVINCRPECI